MRSPRTSRSSCCSAAILAPLTGAQILSLSGWRAIFVALAVLSGAVLIACVGWLPESLPRQSRQSGGLRAAGSVYIRLLRDRRLAGYALTNALVFAAMFAYISGSPFVLEDLHGLSPRQYSIVFAVNALGLVVAAQASGTLVRHVEARLLLSVGATGSALGGVALLLFVTTGAGLWPLLAGFFVVVTSVGLVLPNAAALGLEHHGANAGAAAALLGFGQYLFGGLVAPLVGIQAANAALPTAVVIAGLGIAAVITLATLIRPATRHTDLDRDQGDSDSDDPRTDPALNESPRLGRPSRSPARP